METIIPILFALLFFVSLPYIIILHNRKEYQIRVDVRNKKALERQQRSHELALERMRVRAEMKSKK